MSVNTFKDVLDTAMAETNVEVNFSLGNNSVIINPVYFQHLKVTAPTQGTSTDHAKIRFGSPGAQFDYTTNSSSWCYPNDIENGVFSGKKSQSTSSKDQNPFADGDQMLLWSGSATPGDYLFIPSESTTPTNDTSTEAGVLRVDNSQDSYSNINQDVPLFGGDEMMDVNMDTEDARTSEMEPSADLSQEDPSPFDPHNSFRESTQSSSASAGWTYRQILEIIALPPSEGLNHWNTKVSHLAANLGMPTGATGKDIVYFVLHVASRKNELHRVMPLVKALATAARVLEGRIVAPPTLLPVVLALYPSARPLGGIAAVGAESNGAAWERHDHDEITSECEEEESLKDCDDGDHDGNDDNNAVAEAEAGTGEVGEATSRYKEAVLATAFGPSWTCINHRLTHFS
ncbi:hypothetical protein BGY98DRAFT_1189123 [Russula aff. rugulosa BPL654]|nr:hypothetical protein BGY98DRAFT_1189123 [Russula aff. rugulosa BPL654]